MNIEIFKQINKCVCYCRISCQQPVSLVLLMKSSEKLSPASEPTRKTRELILQCLLLLTIKLHLSEVEGLSNQCDQSNSIPVAAFLFLLPGLITLMPTFFGMGFARDSRFEPKSMAEAPALAFAV